MVLCFTNVPRVEYDCADKSERTPFAGADEANGGVGGGDRTGDSGGGNAGGGSGGGAIIPVRAIYSTV